MTRMLRMNADFYWNRSAKIRLTRVVRVKLKQGAIQER